MPNGMSRFLLLLSVFFACVPALGHVIHRQSRQAVVSLSIQAALLGGCWLVALIAGTGAAIFLAMLAVLPVWCLQIYAAWHLSIANPVSLRSAMRTVWVRGHDIRFLGALFFLTAITDFYIIWANPEYSLAIFCAKPRGVLGILAKAQSPLLHTMIGYGFMHLRRWSLFLYMAYAGFGLLNATVNYACFGYGRVRTAFLVTLIGFTVYVLWRRRSFTA